MHRKLYLVVTYFGRQELQDKKDVKALAKNQPQLSV